MAHICMKMEALSPTTTTWWQRTSKFSTKWQATKKSFVEMGKRRHLCCMYKHAVTKVVFLTNKIAWERKVDTIFRVRRKATNLKEERSIVVPNHVLFSSSPIFSSFLSSLREEPPFSESKHPLLYYTRQATRRKLHFCVLEIAHHARRLSSCLADHQCQPSALIFYEVFSCICSLSIFEFTVKSVSSSWKVVRKVLCDKSSTISTSFVVDWISALFDSRKRTKVSFWSAMPY